MEQYTNGGSGMFSSPIASTEIFRPRALARHQRCMAHKLAPLSRVSGPRVSEMVPYATVRAVKGTHWRAARHAVYRSITDFFITRDARRKRVPICAPCCALWGARSDVERRHDQTPAHGR